jgi:hypothetical protein
VRESFDSYSNVVIDGDRDYILRVRYVLNQILSRRTGREVLEELRNLNAQVTIITWTDVRVQNATEERGIGMNSSIIRYSTAPWTHREMSNGTRRVGPAWSSDSVLCHELAHAVRTASGFARSSMNIPHGPPDREEFFATQVTNLYLSERGEALKARYGDNEILQPESFFAYPPNIQALQQFTRQQPNFVGRLARIRAPFNPFVRVTSTP